MDFGLLWQSLIEVLISNGTVRASKKALIEIPNRARTHFSIYWEFLSLFFGNYTLIKVVTKKAISISYYMPQKADWLLPEV